MTGAQPSPTPQTGERLRLGDARWLVSYAVVAAIRLAVARIAFARLDPRELKTRNRAARRCPAAAGEQASAVLARISYILPRVARRLPWRSDCLIEALAGQDWLRAKGFASEIRIGVEHPEDRPFGAHAWLMSGDTVVTGGDISRYTLLFADEEEADAL
ncbi:MAG: lasso peptide biosynthesis B2 protein [Erythrobacter sp.]